MTGPVLLRALMFQDMYLAGSFVMILSTLTIIGTLISDILLAAVDPRIRYEGGAR
jgi:peptide/nickel transport system permease protein